MDVRFFAKVVPNLRDHVLHLGCGDKHVLVGDAEVGKHSVLATYVRVVVAKAATTTCCGRLGKDSLQTDYHICKACESASQTSGVLNIHQHTYEHFAATAAASTSQVSKCVRQVAINLESVTFMIAFPEPSTRAATACETKLNQLVRRSTALLRERTFQGIPESLTTDGRCPRPRGVLSRDALLPSKRDPRMDRTHCEIPLPQTVRAPLGSPIRPTKSVCKVCQVR